MSERKYEKLRAHEVAALREDLQGTLVCPQCKADCIVTVSGYACCPAGCVGLREIQFIVCNTTPAGRIAGVPGEWTKVAVPERVFALDGK